MSDQTITVGDLKKLVADFIAERDWQQYHDPKNLSMSIAVEAAELMEHFQWVRSDQLGQVLEDPALRDKIGDELADVFAFILSLANVLEIDLSEALREKMIRNAEKYPADTYRGRYK